MSLTLSVLLGVFSTWILADSIVLQSAWLGTQPRALEQRAFSSS